MTLEPDNSTFHSRTRIEFRARSGGQTFVDIRPDTLHSATLNGRPLDLTEAFTGAVGRLQLTGLDETNELIVDATMAYSNDGEGMVRHVDPADGRTYLYAMSFLDAAPRWFACFDQPDLKGPFSLTVRCPPDWTVAGNGPAVRRAPGHWLIEQPHPIATYLMTLVAGPYHVVTGEHDGIILSLRARQSLSDVLDRDAPALLRHTSRCLDELHRLFGTRYPWGEYHQAFVADFNAGAMENPGCVTFRDQLLFRSQATDAELLSRGTTIAHEMAHMWFGDLVTMRWWDDLWLNESFAEYLGHRVCAALGATDSWMSFGVERKAWGFAADRRPSTHPVAGDGAVDAAAALDAFDGISYAKGASVLRQLAERLGDEVFLAGLREYIDAHAFGNAALADLVQAWREAGAADIDGWVAQWLRTSGMDTLRVEDGALMRSAPDPARREHAITVTSYGDTVVSAPMLVGSDHTAIALPAAPLLLPDSGDVTWAKIEISEEAWAAMPAVLPTLDPTARVVVWNALQLAVADAEVSPALALQIAAAAVPREHVEHLIGMALSWALLVAGWSDDPSTVDIVAATANATLAALAPRTRLVAARAVIAATRDVGLLRAWQGGAVPDGVTVDRDVRWRLLTRLCVLGAADATEVDSALAADATSEGRVRAARCRAALPDEAAKDAAWQILTVDPAVANSIVYATAQGFWHPSQRSLTAPFVERYFDEIAATAELRSGWVVGRVASFAYPWTALSAQTVERTSTFLARGDVPSPIRRAVIDRGDDLRRAVLARQRFG